MEIRRITEAADVHAAAHLFDAPPLPDATARFLADDRHHLLIAYADDGTPVGMVTGVETIHPDKGTELFLYELGVDEPYRGRGTGRALTAALAGLARERGCHAMWTVTEEDNPAARATYRAAGGDPETRQVVYAWDFTRSSDRRPDDRLDD